MVVLVCEFGIVAEICEYRVPTEKITEKWLLENSPLPVAEMVF